MGRFGVSVDRRSHVYVLGYSPHPEVLFVKIGKANNPSARLGGYKTHLPGGPSFMLASILWSEESAFLHESRLLSFATSSQEFKAVGGEWFSSSVAGCEQLIAKLRDIGDGCFAVEVKETRKKTGSKKRTWVDDRQDEIRRWREAGSRSPSGVSSGYGGPIR